MFAFYLCFVIVFIVVALQRYLCNCYVTVSFITLFLCGFWFLCHASKGFAYAKIIWIFACISYYDFFFTFKSIFYLNAFWCKARINYFPLNICPVYSFPQMVNHINCRIIRPFSDMKCTFIMNLSHIVLWSVSGISISKCSLWFCSHDTRLKSSLHLSLKKNPIH